MKRLSLTVGILIFAALVMMSCSLPPVVAPGQTPAEQPADSSQTTSPTTEEPASGTGAIQNGVAIVDSVEVQILESFPVQVHVVVKGYLPDGCTTLDQVTSRQEGNEFILTITTQRLADAMCTAALVPYEEVVPLEVEGLSAGQYTVTVNGVSATFELVVDNG